jgi:DNA-binding NarL/FixJ family response regulator
MTISKSSLAKPRSRFNSQLRTPFKSQHSERGTSILPAIHDAEIVLLSSKGNLELDLAEIRKIRSATPEALILLIHARSDETNFLLCIRPGVRGYLPRHASADEAVEAVRAIHAGKAVCPGSLCAALFRYIEHEATRFPSARRSPAARPHAPAGNN